MTGGSQALLQSLPLICASRTVKLPSPPPQGMPCLSSLSLRHNRMHWWSSSVGTPSDGSDNGGGGDGPLPWAGADAGAPGGWRELAGAAIAQLYMQAAALEGAAAALEGVAAAATAAAAAASAAGSSAGDQAVGAVGAEDPAKEDPPVGLRCLDLTQVGEEELRGEGLRLKWSRLLCWGSRHMRAPPLRRWT